MENKRKHEFTLKQIGEQTANDLVKKHRAPNETEAETQKRLEWQIEESLNGRR